MQNKNTHTKIGDLGTLKSRAKAWKKNNRKTIDQVRGQKNLSQSCQTIHDQVFAKVNCLDCANCCKTTGPLFTNRDIERLAKHLNLSFQNFVEKYLREDEDGDMVLQSVPCPFLQSDHLCQVYEFRPKACRAYPHTDASNQNQIFSLTLKNAEICPAVLEILQKLCSASEKAKKGK